MKYACDNCGEIFERKPSAFSRNKSNHRFCSVKCRFAYRLSHENPRKVPLQYTINGAETVIHIMHKGKRYDTYIDTEDLEKVKNHRFSWKVFCVPTQSTQYVTSSSIRLHRLIMDCPKGMVIDHIDGNGLNNHKSNLRICTHAQNCQNIHGVNSRNVTSGIRGVSWHKKDKRWRVRVRHKLIGEYKDLETAKQVAIEARRKLLPFSVE